MERHAHHVTEFPGKHEGEVFQFSFRQHWMRIMTPVIRTAVLSLLIGLVGVLTYSFATPATMQGNHVILLFLLAFFLGVQMEFLIRLYRYFLNIIIVTDRKIHHIKKTLIVLNEHQSIDIWMLQEINKQQRGPFQNMLNFGTLRLEAQDTHMSIHFVPQINERYRDILHLRERARGAQEKAT